MVPCSSAVCAALLDHPFNPRLGLVVSLLIVLGGCAGEPSPNGAMFADIHGLAVDPNDPGLLYVATHHGLFRGQNDQDWARITADPLDLMGFTMHPHEPHIMYASGHPAQPTRDYHHLGVVRSADGGRTWQTLALRNEVDFHALAVSLARPDTLWAWYYGDANLYQSTDAGRTWNQWKPTGLTGDVYALAADATDAQSLYAGGANGLFVSRDAGVNWTNMTAPTGVLAVATTLGDPNLVWIATESGTLLRSTDRAATWQAAAAIAWAANDWPAAIAIDPTRPDTVYAASGQGSIYRSVDAGQAWTAVRPGPAES